MTDALIAVRFLHLAATVMLVGAVFFHNCIRATAFGPNVQVIGADARFTQTTAWISFAVAVASGSAWLVLLTAQISGDTIKEALSGDVLTLLTETQFGRVAEMRLLIATLLAGAMAWDKLWGGFRWIAVGLAVCFAGSLAWAGHSGAGDGLSGDIQVMADAFHLIAASAWLGGLIPLAYFFMLGMQAANKLSSMEVADVTRRFSNLGIVSVATLLITGFINTWFLVGNIAILVGSTYGLLLIIKVALFLVMVGFAAINRTWLTPAITAGASSVRTKAMLRLARNSLIEAGLGLAIIAIVGALGMLPAELPEEQRMHIHGH